ncbi:MAG: formyl transferase, partial [Bacteroidales bacterium]|nr:formyl transferase [Bacteroidales bacterium]
MRVILIGAVSSSAATLNKLINHNFDVSAVFGHEPKKPQSVSGLVNMRKVCEENDIDYFPFKKINDQVHIERMRKIKPEVLFAVGF